MRQGTEVNGVLTVTIDEGAKFDLVVSVLFPVVRAVVVAGRDGKVTVVVR